MHLYNSLLHLVFDKYLYQPHNNPSTAHFYFQSTTTKIITSHITTKVLYLHHILLKLVCKKDLYQPHYNPSLAFIKHLTSTNLQRISLPATLQPKSCIYVPFYFNSSVLNILISHITTTLQPKYAFMWDFGFDSSATSICTNRITNKILNCCNIFASSHLHQNLY